MTDQDNVEVNYTFRLEKKKLYHRYYLKSLIQDEGKY